MICYPKETYLKEDELPPANRNNWQEVSFQEQTKEYQGRTYQVLKVTERFLSASERIESGLKALIAVVSTLGLALIFSSTVRDLCLSAINGKEKEIYWKPVDNFGLYKFNLDQGLVLSQLDSQEKAALKSLVKKWEAQISFPAKYTLSSLATLLKQKPSTLQKLFDLVYLLPNSKEGYDRFGLDRLFSSLGIHQDKPLGLNLRAGITELWEGIHILTSMIFEKGESKENWTVTDLSHFLAVSQSALIQFLGEKKESYSYQEIDTALKTTKKNTIDTVLESNRTQAGSIRWAMLSYKR